MLQDIRNNFQGTMAKVIIAVICIPFVFFGVESIFGGGPSNNVAEVNGEVITLQELNEAVFLQKRRLISQLGDQLDPAMLDDQRLKKPALDSLVNRKLMIQTAKDQGLSISDDQINQGIRQMPDFQQDGRFSQQRFEALLNSTGMTSSIFKRLYASDLLVSQLSSAWVGSSFVTASELEQNVAFTHETRDVRFIRLSHAEALKEITVDNQALKQYYQKHPEQFQSDEAVMVEYLVLEKSNFEPETITDEQLRQAYDNELAASANQSVRTVAHILIDADKSSEAAKKTLQEVQQKLAAGESFAKLAKQYSDDLGSKNNGGEIGPLDADAFPEAFVQAAMALKEKQVSDIVKTDAGFHLIKLNDLQKQQAPSFAERKPALLEQLKQAKAEPAYWAALEQLKDVSFNAPDLQEPSELLGLQVETAGPIKKTGNQGMFANRDIVSSLFSDAALNDGLNTEVLELSSEKAVVLRVKEHQKPQLIAFADVKADVEQAYRQQQAKSLLKAKADAILKSLQSGKTVEQVAGAEAEQWQLELGAKRNSGKLPRALLQQAFALPAVKGKDKQALSTVTLSNNDIAIVAVNNVQAGDLAAVEGFEREALKQFLQRNSAQMTFVQLQQHVKANADIEYN